MNNITKEAIAEAERFIRYAKKIPSDVSWYANPERAQAKRASMCLTRTLAKFRAVSANDWRAK